MRRPQTFFCTGLWLLFNSFQAASHLYLAATDNLAAYLGETTAII